MPNPNAQADNQTQTGTPSYLNWLKEGALQADTAVRAAANTLTFGGADNFAAAMDATLGQEPGTWPQRYDADLKAQAARNVYDAIHRSAMRHLGEAGGIGIGMMGGNVAGIEGSAALPIKTKGLLGEILSTGKTILKGDWPADFQVPHRLQNGLKTIVDHDTAKGISVESKFGPSARLTKNQRYAQQQWGPQYRVDRWGPSDIGVIGAGAAGAGGLLSAGLQEQQSGQDASDQDDQFPSWAF